MRGDECGTRCDRSRCTSEAIRKGAGTSSRIFLREELYSGGRTMSEGVDALIVVTCYERCDASSNHLIDKLQVDRIQVLVFVD